MAEKTWIATGSTPASWDTAANWSPSNEPAAGDNVEIPPGTAPIAGSDQSANELGLVRVIAGQTGALGGAATAGAVPTYLKLKCTRFEYAGLGRSYIDLHNSAIVPRILDTQQPPLGYHGLYLKGSALTGLNVQKGNVGLAVLLGETATINTTAQVLGAAAQLVIGSGVTITTLDVKAGLAILRAALTTLNLFAGQVETQEVGALTTANILGGLFVPNSSGTIATLEGKGGVVDTFRSSIARTITNLKLYRDFEFRWNKEAVTVSNWLPQESASLALRRVA